MYNSKIFESYSDELALRLYKAYGMKKKMAILNPPQNSTTQAPWLRRTDNKIYIDDPHRGEIELNSNEEQDLFLMGYIWEK